MDQYLQVSYRISGYLVSGMILLIPALVFLVLFLYFNIRILTGLLERYMPGRWEKWIQYASVFSIFNYKELLWTLLLSFSRYIVFSTQFFILLRIAGTGLPFSQAVFLIPVIYLVMTVIPTIALTDLGIRGSVSLFVLGLYFQKYGTGNADTEIAILTSSSVLWLINLVIPAIMGTFFVFSLKFFRK